MIPAYDLRISNDGADRLYFIYNINSIWGLGYEYNHSTIS